MEVEENVWRFDVSVDDAEGGVEVVEGVDHREGYLSDDWKLYGLELD